MGFGKTGYGGTCVTKLGRKTLKTLRPFHHGRVRPRTVSAHTFATMYTEVFGPVSVGLGGEGSMINVVVSRSSSGRLTHAMGTRAGHHGVTQQDVQWEGC